MDINIDGDDCDGEVTVDDGGDDAPADNALPPISVDDYEISPWITADNGEYPGTFRVGETGEVGVDFLFDGGAYQGEIAVFSLEGMQDLEVGSEAFIRLAADRALSDSPLGHVVIQDLNEGAKFSHAGWEPDFNVGDYQGVKTVTMNPGDRFAVMLVPNGTVEDVWADPDIDDDKTPLFSLDSANPQDGTYLTRMADVTGDGNTFAMEDWRLDANSDRDYNDVVFQIRGAKGDAPLMDEMVDPGRDWRNEDFGQALVSYAQSYIDGTDYEALDADSDPSDRPLVGIIDTGFSSDSDVDYTGSDLIDGDDNPFFAEGEGDGHGDRALESFSEINDDAPVWVGRAVGSGRWAESLVEFVDAARESGQPNAVVNLSMDLTQIDAEGNISTRYEFTPLEMAALEYARQNDVLVAVAAGNEGGVMSALGQASEQFDHIITVGSAEEIDADVPVWQGSDRADYSSYGKGLDIVADGTLGDTEGTSLAVARVAGAASRVWAANPELSYQQVIEVLRETAIDLNAPGWDVETGAGLLNLVAAVQLAKTMQEEEYEKELQYVPLTWSGDGEVTPMERAANNGASGSSASGSSPSWDSFLGIFGSYSSPNWRDFLRRIYDRFYNTNVLPKPQYSSINSSPSGTVAVGQNADGRLETFVVDENKNLWHRWQLNPSGAGGWSNWSKVEGFTVKEVTVAQNADGRLEAFVIESDGDLWHRWQLNPSGAGGWSNWSKVEGFTVKEVTVAQNADGRLEAFVIESDGDLWHRWQLNPSGAGGWSNWSKIEGFTVKEVTVAQNADGRL